MSRHIETRTRELMAERQEIADRLSIAVAAAEALKDAPLRAQKRAQEAVTRARQEAAHFEKVANGFSEQISRLQSAPKTADPLLVSAAARSLCEPNTNVVVYRDPMCTCGGAYTYAPETALFQCSNPECGATAPFMGQDTVTDTVRKPVTHHVEDSSSKGDVDVVYRDYVNQFCSASPETPQHVLNYLATNTLLKSQYHSPSVVKPTKVSTLTRKMSTTRRPQRIIRELEGRLMPEFSPQLRDRLVERFNEFHRVYDTVKHRSSRCKIPNFDTLTRAFLFLDGEYELSEQLDSHKSMPVIETENSLIAMCFDVLRGGSSAFNWDIDAPHPKRPRLTPFSSHPDPPMQVPESAQVRAAEVEQGPPSSASSSSS